MAEIGDIKRSAHKGALVAYAGEDGNGGRTGVYKTEKSKVEMPCFFYEKK